MKRTTKSIFFYILLLIPIIVVNYYVDSYAGFRVTYNKIGETSIKSNYCVGTDIPLSERKAKWAHLNKMEPVDYLILGSSRSMLFSSGILGFSSFYNVAVSGGCSVNDYMAETYVLYHQNKLPSHMMIEISPSLFNIHSGEVRWKEWGNNSDYMRQVLNGENVNQDDSYLLGIQYKDLISPDYFKYNFEQLLAGKRTKYIINQYDEDDELTTWHVDGSIAYSKHYQVLYNDERKKEGIKKICDSNTIYSCQNYNELDSNLIMDFERLLIFLKQEGITISFYLPPYASDMYKYICETECFSTIPKVEEWAIEYGMKNGIQVYGSYNPEHLYFTLADLYDEYHVKVNRIIDTLWVRNPDAPDDWHKQTSGEDKQ